MLNLGMTSGWVGACVSPRERIEGPIDAARPRHDLVEVLAGGTFQRPGTASA